MREVFQDHGKRREEGEVDASMICEIGGRLGKEWVSR